MERAATLGDQTLDGVITMPSFHSCGAVLLAWGFAKVRWLKWPFLALNAAMLVHRCRSGAIIWWM